MKNVGHLDNYDLFLMPNGVYEADTLSASNYLYPMYAWHDGSHFLASTSAYELILRKNRFLRNPRFQTVDFFSPTYLTIDREIFRVRTTRRRSTRTLTDSDEITSLAATLVQSYVSEIENRFPKATHILLMGGKDSQNIILAGRSRPWIVVSGEPNAEFLEKNKIEVSAFFQLTDDPDNRCLSEELMASDCFYSLAEIRYVPFLKKLIAELRGEAIIWLGTSGDSLFCRNANHRDRDYFAVHELHVGMAMGIQHQILKNVLGVPALSPFQSPQMLDDLFYKFDPYFVDCAGDIRSAIGEQLNGREVLYPSINPGPGSWKRERKYSISTYTSILKTAGVRTERQIFLSSLHGTARYFRWLVDQHSAKKRTTISKMLFPVRRALSTVWPSLESKRHNIEASEIK
jgi:hypothetical protein